MRAAARARMIMHARADVWRERSVWEAGDDDGDAWGGAGAVGAVHGAGLTQPHRVHRGGAAELPLGCGRGHVAQFDDTGHKALCPVSRVRPKVRVEGNVAAK